jgi:NADH:ubiquinone oxidoreductase subunit 6 (subunit J)
MTPTQLFRLAGALFILAGIASLIARNYVFVAVWMALGGAFLAISGTIKSSK